MPAPHRLVLLHVEDIAPAQALVRDLPGVETCVFDPVLIDRARAAGLPGVRWLPWRDAPRYADLHTEAHAAATALERELERLATDAGAAVSIEGWQHLTLYYLHMALGWHTGLARALVPQLGEGGATLHILVCDTPAIYYFNAFVPALLVLHEAQAQGIGSAAYTYGRKADTSALVPRLDGQAPHASTGGLLAHLPTCMYDLHHFNDELRASGRPVTAIEARHFDMPVAAHMRVPLVAAEALAEPLAPALQATIDRATARIAARLDTAFADKIPAASFRARQVAQVAGTYRAQMQTLHLLERHFETAPPYKILLSDHDTGFHGPLIAYARRRHVPVLLLPHSKTTPDLEFAGGGITALTHPAQGDDMRDANGRAIVHHALALPAELRTATRMRAPLARIGLLLNALTLAGIPFADVAAYLDGIRRLAAWCEAKGLALDVRCKPGYSIVELLVAEAGLDRERLARSAAKPMAEYAAGCDVCLMYDTPTAGAFEFLDKGIPILNPLVTPLTRAQAVTTNPDVVPRLSIDETLLRLEGYLADAAQLQRFALRQFARHVAGFGEARALRSWL